MDEQFPTADVGEAWAEHFAEIEESVERLDVAIVADARIDAVTSAVASMAEEIDHLRGEVAQLRDGNANLIRNAEILADELIHATAERDELAAALNEALPKLWTYERAQEETAE